MKEIVIRLFGEGKDLEWYHMTDRALLMFIVALVLVRISGRRSFSMKSPFDNTITILLGAILSRGVVGASPFLSVCSVGLALALAHRVLAWAVIHNKMLARIVRGKAIPLYKNGSLLRRNMDKSLICEDELRENIRIKANMDGFDGVDAAYVETNGEIGVVKKK